MDSRDLMLAVLNTDPRRQQLIETVLSTTDGGLDALEQALACCMPTDSAQEQNIRLLTITEACRMLNVNYPKMYRIMNDGLLDVVAATGKRMIREESLIEYSKGLRNPSPEVLARREARNALRRRQYAEKGKASAAQRLHGDGR